MKVTLFKRLSHRRKLAVRRTWWGRGMKNDGGWVDTGTDPVIICLNADAIRLAVRRFGLGE